MKGLIKFYVKLFSKFKAQGKYPNIRSYVYDCIDAMNEKGMDGDEEEAREIIEAALTETGFEINWDFEEPDEDDMDYDDYDDDDPGVVGYCTNCGGAQNDTFSKTCRDCKKPLVLMDKHNKPLILKENTMEDIEKLLYDTMGGVLTELILNPSMTEYEYEDSNERPKKVKITPAFRRALAGWCGETLPELFNY